MDALKASHGSIVNVSSIAVFVTGSSIPYAASKAALNHMTVLLANRRPEVRVNAVAPVSSIRLDPGLGRVRGYVQGVAPLRRTGRPTTWPK